MQNEKSETCLSTHLDEMILSAAFHVAFILYLSSTTTQRQHFAFVQQCCIHYFILKLTDRKNDDFVLFFIHSLCSYA